MILQFFSKRNYAFFKNFVDAIKKHAKNQNYAIVVKRQKFIYFFERVVKYTLMCDRQNQSKRKFEVKSRKIEIKRCDCKFKVNAIYKKHLKT